MQSLVLYLLGLGVGIGLVVQVGMNSTLRAILGSALVAALISFAVGTLALAAFVALTRTPLPVRAQLAAVPAWAWLGGILGAFYVASSVIVGPRLGAATLSFECLEPWNRWRSQRDGAAIRTTAKELDAARGGAAVRRVVLVVR
jgi:uncharacterized membrane protein YdcZ (DUF606 family)